MKGIWANLSTVALTTVGSIVDYGGLGTLIVGGLQSDFKAQVLTASVLCVLLAVLADLLLLGVQRLLTPWTRVTGSGRGGRGFRIRRSRAGGPGADAERVGPMPEKVAPNRLVARGMGNPAKASAGTPDRL